MQAPLQPRPLGELFIELASETGTLVRKEVALATVEMTHKAKAIAGGGAIAALGAMGLMAGLILALGTLIPLWASSLLVGGVVSIAGVVLVMLGIRAFRALDARPRQLIETLEEDKQWLKEQVSR